MRSRSRVTARERPRPGRSRGGPGPPMRLPNDERSRSSAGRLDTTAVARRNADADAASSTPCQRVFTAAPRLVPEAAGSAPLFEESRMSASGCPQPAAGPSIRRNHHCPSTSVALHWSGHVITRRPFDGTGHHTAVTPTPGAKVPSPVWRPTASPPSCSAPCRHAVTST